MAHDEAKLPEADVKTDLRMRQAYARRGLALEVADIMTFTVHEKLVDKMFQEYQREPPMGYSQVSLKQIAEADRRAWKLVSEQLQGDLGRDGNRNLHADAAMEKMLTEPAFLTLLMPLPGGRPAAAASSASEAPDGAGEGIGAGKRKLMKENQKLKERLKAMEGSSEKKPKNQEKPAAAKKMPVKMPKELWGYSPMMRGERLCYGFQLGTCQAEVKDNKCSKGLHTCMKCWKDGHGALQCKK